MALPNRTRVIDDLIASTFYAERTKVIDQVFTITPFYDKMVENGRIKARVEGGTHFEIPLSYDKLNQNTKWMARGATTGRAEKQSLTTALYTKQILGTAIPRFFKDEIKNKGKQQIINYAAYKVANTKSGLVDTLETDSLIQNADPEAINALGTLISTAPTTGTVGGIDRATNAWWRNQVKDFSALSVAGSLLAEMTTMYNNCSNYKAGTRRAPDVLLTDQTTMERYEGICRALGQIVLNPNGNRADLGFGNLIFKGCEMFYAPALAGLARIYFLNTEHLEFSYDPDYWFYMTEWKEGPNEIDRVAQVLSVCQLCADNFVKQGVIFGINND